MTEGAKIRFRQGGTSHSRPLWPARWHGTKHEQARKRAERAPTPAGQDYIAVLKAIRERLGGGQ
jgi:hypothetical protein